MYSSAAKTRVITNYYIARNETIGIPAAINSSRGSRPFAISIITRYEVADNFRPGAATAANSAAVSAGGMIVCYPVIENNWVCRFAVNARAPATVIIRYYIIGNYRVGIEAVNAPTEI